MESVGVVSDVPPSITVEEILENIESDNNTKVFKAERIMKKVGEGKFVPTYSVKLFVKGENLPNSVKIYGTNRFVEPYIFPLKLCLRCWRYGHREKFCKAKEARCCNCGQEHTEDKCEVTEVKCVNCAGNHKAISRECSERVRQNQIREVMTVNKTSFFEAAEKYPKKPKNDLQGRLESVRGYTQLGDGNRTDNTPQPKQRRNRIVSLQPNFPTPQNWFNSQNQTTEFLQIHTELPKLKESLEQ